MMAGFALIGSILLLCIGLAVTMALLSTEKGTDAEEPEAYAVLPVPEDTPHVRAFLEYYASQISWMDAAVLRCVILVYNPGTEALCRDMARDYACYQAMPPEELHTLLMQQMQQPSPDYPLP